VDAAEKNSFNCAMDDDRSKHRNPFRLHYFPQIPITPASESSGTIHKGSDFRRIECQKSGNSYDVLLEKSEPGGEYQKHSESTNNVPVENAYAKGYRDGQKAGMDSEKKRLESNLNRLTKLLTEIEEIRMEVFRNAEKEVVNLALAIATKIVRHEISTKKEVVINVVSEALKKPVDHEKIKIRVSPSDYHFLKEEAFKFLNDIDNPGNIIFEEDKTIENGGCFIETSLGGIDARIEKQLQAVNEAFKLEFQKSNLPNGCKLK
jgi:flagellar biosynthesis/type III secretory pathway protein FliH